MFREYLIENSIYFLTELSTRYCLFSVKKVEKDFAYFEQFCEFYFILETYFPRAFIVLDRTSFPWRAKVLQVANF